ncbi:efflux RND transporter periplasmic adaptor subunit [Herbaspirillum sp. RTI4]|uniref:efflux RND transporter periplasmic adaptor subunit n=1 Tax=Herbaspirillum sp. RTI4 TaxID=3048640 RepID=UPI002AB4188B|nr:efflux RND transporter periplasmic adaptor subunit [Herbaspirillum sp. RTI4]MDY7578104.1 efflux RND transporter periplasmic adaptor subunit [Herbaspirillum sp. RTI4]MEA9980693.1 efflux RND transporter periplasmic adaptor subunit [Herbaspirillum sp. RTI4]
MDTETQAASPRSALLRGSVLALAVLVVVAAGGVALWWRRPPPVVAPVKPATVIVERSNIEQTVTASGRVRMQSYVDVGAQVSGQVKNVFVAIGDTVKAGKVLVEIAPTEQTGRQESNRAQLARAKAELAGQNAQLDFARLQFQRQMQLKAANATREESVESSRMNVASAEAQVAAKQAQIQQTQATMQEDETIRRQTRISAPISGTVVTLPARLGQAVTANRDVLLRISDLTNMTVEVRVAESDVTRLRKGMIAYFSTPGFPGKRWSGKLRQILPLSDTEAGKPGAPVFYTVLFDVANTTHELMSGMSAEVSFVLARADAAIAIPVGMVGKADSSGMQTVRVMEEGGKLTPRKIKTGIRDAQQVQVLEGLKPGDEIAAAP